jgi:hypothetical protein
MNIQSYWFLFTSHYFFAFSFLQRSLIKVLVLLPGAYKRFSQISFRGQHANCVFVHFVQLQIALFSVASDFALTVDEAMF